MSSNNVTNSIFDNKEYKEYYESYTNFRSEYNLPNNINSSAFQTKIIEKYLSEEQLINIRELFKKKFMRKFIFQFILYMNPKVIYDSSNLNILSNSSRLARRSYQGAQAVAELAPTALGIATHLSILRPHMIGRNAEMYLHKMRVNHLNASLTYKSIHSLRNIIHDMTLINYEKNDVILYLGVSYIYDFLSKIRIEKFYRLNREEGKDPRYIYFKSLLKVVLKEDLSISSLYQKIISKIQRLESIYEHISLLHINSNNVTVNPSVRVNLPVHENGSAGAAGANASYIGGYKHKKSISKKVTKRNKKAISKKVTKTK
jgi:hypothetical protein